jgi:hypothetical protein
MARLKTAVAAILAITAPLHHIFIAVFFLVTLDLILAIIASIKSKVAIQSGKLKGSVIKLLAYNTSIVVSYIVESNLTGPDVPVLRMVTTIIGLTELKSVLEHLDVITGGGVIKAILVKINAGKKD